ncbi:SH3 domain-containing protein [Microbacterium sp. PRC9]|uniref:SH3 domain-containing protein n=1 Tax=Microbacterium sp. PRC9 TaxID=2962591 RepID=UPI0028813E8B|nr:SH3 domain-containing protein [Microbacterium sp. PRC9]MDT0141105.1 SH3 domain-containing protein [Microbacterium sp. PRC9]
MVVSLVAGLLLAPATASAVQSEQVDAAVAAEAAASGIAKMADLSQFQPGNIISDAKFFDRGTMTEAQIQSFLQSRVPSCQSGYTCLKDAYDTSRTTSPDAMCGAYSGGIRERASAIIYKVAQACGINPQVILVMLQKEQGLVTHTWPSDWRYTIAMGQGCPDTAACDTRYYGFFNQVYGAAWQLKRYANPPGTSQYFTWYAPGKTWNVRWHPNAGCGSSPVYIQNQATADLYYYTPYQPNAAALRAGYGEGDGCSSYGNRNFFQYFTDWFGSTTDPCAQPPFAQVSSAAGILTAAATVPARIAPSEGCNNDALWLPAGLAVSVQAEWNSWYWVNVGGNMRWMLKSHLNASDACAQPPYTQVRSASGTMVTATAVTGRATASTGCSAGSAQLAAGARVTLAAEWSDWYWADYRGAMLWIPKSQLAPPPEPCTQPPYSEVVGAAGTMVTTAGVTARTSANVDCTAGSVALAKGTRVTLSAQWSDWYWVSANGAMLWVPKSQLAAAADPCTQPPYEQVRGATGTMVAASGLTARVAPNSSCTAGAINVTEGVRVTVSAEWSDWYWVSASGSMVWIPKAQLKAYAPCTQPPFAQVSSASGAMFAATTITARQAPDAACESGSTQLSAGTRVDLLAKWSDWYWIESGGAQLWVRATDLAAAAPSTCVQPRYEEVVGASGTATAREGATARPAPSTLCTAGVVSPAAGTSVTLHARWSSWYWAEVGGQMLWIPTDRLTLSQTVTTTAAVNLRSSASTTAPVILIIPAGTSLDVRSQTAGWYEVSYQNRSGWVSSQYVR